MASSRRNAFRQCDVERLIRAAKATGAGAVIVRPDGSMQVVVEPVPESERPKQQSVWREDIVL